MPIEQVYIADQHALITRFHGTVDDATLLGTYRTLYAGSEAQPGYQELALVDAGFRPEITTMGILRLLHMVATFHGPTRPRTAGVIGTLGHELWITHAQELIRRLPLGPDVAVFKDAREAVDHLGLDPALLPPEVRSRFGFEHRLGDTAGEGLAAAQHARSELEATYRQLFANAGPIAVIDVRTGRFVRCNARFVQQCGHSHEELLEMRMSDLDLADQPSDTIRRIETILRQGALTFEARHRTKDGRVLELLVHATHLQLEGQHFVQGMFVDLTDQRALERQVREQRDVLDAITRLQALFIDNRPADEVFGSMLDEVLRLTEAAAGVLCACPDTADGPVRSLAVVEPGGRSPHTAADMATLSCDTPTGLLRAAAATGALQARHHPPAVAVPLIHGDRVAGVIGLLGEHDRTSAPSLVVVWQACAQLIAAHGARSANRARKRQLERTLAGTGAGTVMFDAAARSLRLDARAIELLGADRASLPLESWPELVHPDDREDAVALLDAELTAGTERVTFTFRTNDAASTTHVRADCFVRTEDGGERSVYALVLDVTERRRAERLLRTTRARYERLVENLGPGIVVFSRDPVTREVLYASDGCESVFGVPARALLGKPIEARIQWAPGELDRARRRGAALMAGDDVPPTELFRFVHPDGDTRVISVTSHRSVDEAGRTVLDGLVQDVTLQQAMATRLAYTASHDALTGVLNRRAIEDRLSHHLTPAPQGARPLAVALFDIDHFKRVNDTWGHAVGDAVLVAFAHAIEGAIREQDVLGRYGGEEFLLLLPDCSEQQVVACVERVRRAVAALEVPAEHGTIQITTSAGVARRRHGQEPADALLARADAALYAAKASGRDRVALG